MQQQKTNATKFLQRRKLFTMLPLLVLPFMTFLLWSLGLIGVTQSQSQAAHKGLNMSLPDAIAAKDSNWNKLSFYEQADKDSANYKSLQKNDPYFGLSSMDGQTDGNDTTSKWNDKAYEKNHLQFSYDPAPPTLQKNKDANEEKVYKKLAQLNEALNNTDKEQDINQNKNLTNNNAPADTEASANTSDVERLENMMKNMQASDNAGDPEMQQINGMLEKILDIQHPERINEKLKQESQQHKDLAFPVLTSNDADNISLLQSKNASFKASSQNNQPTQNNAFFSLDSKTSADETTQNVIDAEIPETQIVVSGATVRLRVNNDVYINGILVPKGQFVFGMAALNGERLTIEIKTIRYQNNILPIALSVYDMDGMEGIYMPGAISRDVAKQSADQAIQGMNIATLDPSIGAQAASAGIQAAKSLIGKKTKLVKVTIKAGYRVLLRDENQHN